MLRTCSSGGNCFYFRGLGYICLKALLSGKESACNAGDLGDVGWRPRRCGSDPWVRKAPWRRKWQATPVFLPEKSHGQRSLADGSPRGCKELNTRVRVHACTHAHTHRQRNSTCGLDLGSSGMCLGHTWVSAVWAHGPARSLTLPSVGWG